MNGNKGETRIEEPTRAQRAVARRAAESRATVPHVELSSDVAIAAALAPAERSLIAILVKASALALAQVPRANASYRDGRFELYSRINVGVALPTADAFAIPTVFDADAKPVSELTEEIDGLTERSRRGELSPPELSGGTFTVSEVAAGRGSPLIVAPQAAALGGGQVRSVPAVRDGAIVPEPMITITLACDHRILYGHEAARFLAAIVANLEQGNL